MHHDLNPFWVLAGTATVLFIIFLIGFVFNKRYP